MTPAASTYTPPAGKVFGEYIDRVDVSVMGVWGTSLPFGGGSSDGDRDTVTRVASMLGTREENFAVGGQVLSWHQTGGQGDGGYAKFLQTDFRKQRPNTTLTAQASSGQAVCTVASTTGMVVGDRVHVGDGDPADAVNGGEGAFIKTIDSATQVTLSANLARTHANGQPFYVVPTSWINLRPLYWFWTGINDLAAGPISSSLVTALERRFLDVLELIVCHASCAEVYQESHTSVVYSGTGWAAPTTLSSANSGTTARAISTAAATFTIHTPEDFLGGEIDLGFVIGSTGGATDPVLAFTVDGVSAGSLTFYDNVSGKLKGVVKRLTGLSAGRHEIGMSVTTLGNRTVYFDWWGIVAQERPFIAITGFNRPVSYAVYSTWTNAQRTTTFTSLAGTTINVASTTGMLVGQTVSFVNGDVREVTAVNSATQFVVNTALSNTPAGSSTVTYGIQDADIATMNTKIQNLIATFSSSRILIVDVDTTLNKDPKYFWHDLGHFSDEGHRVLAKIHYDAWMAAPGLSQTLTASTGTPTAPFPSDTVFVGAGTATQLQYANQASGAVDWFNNQSTWQEVDLRRVHRANFSGNVIAAGAAAAVAYVQYSTDLGTTWQMMGLSATYVRQGSPFQLALGSTGRKSGGWSEIPRDARVERCLVKVVGESGNGTADPSATFKMQWG